MPLRITQVDAFTNRPFAGNPAAVCILPKAAEPAWMLNVAREMNLAETAFLVPQRDGYDLGWFTAAKHKSWIALNFPATPASAAAPPVGLVAALGATPKFVGRSRFDYLV